MISSAIFGFGLGSLTLALVFHVFNGKLRAAMAERNVCLVRLEGWHRDDIANLAEAKRQAQYWQDVAGDLAKCCSKTSNRPLGWSTIDK